MGKITFDTSEFIIRFTKYVLEGIVVAVAAFFFPDQSLKIEDVLLIALTASCTFALLDTFAPSIGSSVRSGAGFGVGFNMVGFGSKISGR